MSPTNYFQRFFFTFRIFFNYKMFLIRVNFYTNILENLEGLIANIKMNIYIVLFRRNKEKCQESLNK